MAAYTYTFKAFDGALSSGTLLHITSSASTSATLGGTVFATQSAQSTLSGAVRVTNASSITFGGDIITAKQLNFKAFDAAGLSAVTQHRIIDSGHFVQTTIGGTIYSSAVQLNFKAFDQSGFSTSSSLSLSTGSRNTEHTHVGGDITVGHFVNIDAGGSVLAPVEASSVVGGLIRDRSQINLRFEDGISPSTFITYFTNLIPRAASFIANGTVSGLQSLLVSMGGDIRRNKALNLRFEDGISPSVLRTYYVDEVIRAASVTLQGNIVNPVAQTFTGSIVCAETVQGDLFTQKTFTSVISDVDVDSSVLDTLIYLTGAFSSSDSLQGEPYTQKLLPAKIWPSQSSLHDLFSSFWGESAFGGLGWVFLSGSSSITYGQGPYVGTTTIIARPWTYPGRLQHSSAPASYSVATGSIWTHSLYISGTMGVGAGNTNYFTTHPSRSSVSVGDFSSANDGISFVGQNPTSVSVLPSAVNSVIASGVIDIGNGWKRVWYTGRSPYGRADSFLWSYWENSITTTVQYKSSGWGLKDEIGFLTEPYLPNELSGSLFTEKTLDSHIFDSDSMELGDFSVFRAIDGQLIDSDLIDQPSLNTSIRFAGEITSDTSLYADLTAKFNFWGDVVDSDTMSGALFKGTTANALDSKNPIVNRINQSSWTADGLGSGQSVDGPFPGTIARRYGWNRPSSNFGANFRVSTTGSLTSSGATWTQSIYIRFNSSGSGPVSLQTTFNGDVLYGVSYADLYPGFWAATGIYNTGISGAFGVNAFGVYPVQNGYYRFWRTLRPLFTTGSTGQIWSFIPYFDSFYSPNTSASWDVYGAQLEPGYLTEYVPLFEGLSGSFDTQIPLASSVSEIDSTSGSLSTEKVLTSQIFDSDLMTAQMGAPQQIDFDGQMSDSDTAVSGDLSTTITFTADVQESDFIHPAVFRTAALLDGNVIDVDELIGNVQIQASFDGELVDIDTTSITDLSTGIRLAQTLSDSFTLSGQLQSSIVMEGSDSSNSAMVGSLTIDRRRPPKHHRVRGILRRTLARWWAIYDDEY